MDEYQEIFKSKVLTLQISFPWKDISKNIQKGCPISLMLLEVAF